jgi:alanine racemase
VSDEAGEAPREYTAEQFELFMRVIDAVKERSGIEFAIRHCANSGAVVNYPEMNLDMVRPGLLLYGYGDDSGRLGLKPCMRLVTTVSTIKFHECGTSVSYGRRFVTDGRTRMGVLAIGYADGLNRRLGNGQGYCIVNGHKAPYVGNICMDVCMIDVTDINCREGDSVEIFGPQLPVTQLAEWLGTIPYEVMTGISTRVRRIYTLES